MSNEHHASSTRAAHLGRDTDASSGFVNLPVYHGSTVLSRDYEEFVNSAAKRSQLNQVTYGRTGTPASFALEKSVAELEGAFAGISVSSGLAAITCALTAFTESGSHVLMTDSVYRPARNFCDQVLRRYGVETTYYDPCIGAGIAELIRPSTAVIFMESPGSNTFEIQDIPAITQAARHSRQTHRSQIVTMLDNTWATPIYLQPFDLGIDISIHAATKYITGHSDTMLGIVTATQECYFKLRETVRLLGQNAGPDAIFLGLRGLRTLPTRLRQHHESAVAVARWLSEQSEVARVIHPALPSHAGHEIFKRDFKGASGLFAFVLKPLPPASIQKFFDASQLFGMGYSWGGFESLMIPFDPTAYQSATQWTDPGQGVRMHVGLESPSDLIDDLRNCFSQLRQSG